MFINFWYVACQSSEVPDDKPIKVQMLGQSFALWRDTAGEIHCVANACPHRAGALGEGRLNGDCIECPYHGWTFDKHGTCVRLPSLGPQAKIPERTRIDAYPVEEKYGLVHVFLGDLPEDERPAVYEIPEADDPDTWWPQVFSVEWKIDYKRSVENTLDPAHNEFVHDTHGFSGRNEDYHVVDFDLDEYPLGSGFMAKMYAPPLPEEDMDKASGRSGDAWAEAGSGNYGPNVTWTYIHISPQAMFHNITFHTPVNEELDRIYVIMYRNFMHDEKVDDDFVKRFWYVAEQDRVVLEAMEPVMTPDHNRFEYFPAGRQMYRPLSRVLQRLGGKGLADRCRQAGGRPQESCLCDPQPRTSRKAAGLGHSGYAAARRSRGFSRRTGSGLTLQTGADSACWRKPTYRFSVPL